MQQHKLVKIQSIIRGWLFRKEQGLTSANLLNLKCHNEFKPPRSQLDYYMENNASKHILSYVSLQGKTFGEKYMEQIAKEYPELAAQASRNETGAKGRFQNLVNQRSRKLFDEKIVAKETVETATKKTTKKVAKKEARETAVERYAKFATSQGLFYGTAFAILKVPAEALADVIGDTADSFLGNS